MQKHCKVNNIIKKTKSVSMFILYLLSKSVCKMFRKIFYNTLHGIILFRWVFDDYFDLEYLAR